MKRVADKQLSKDDMDGDDDVEEVGTGFKKADESVLARRPYNQGLPRRSLAAPANASATPSAPATSEAPAAPPKFVGFSGFGSSSAGSSGPAAFTSSQPAFSSSPFSFSSTTSAQPVSSIASVSSGASNATKAFASFVSSISSPDTTSTPPASGNAMPKADDKEVEYYKAIRGLNVSLLSAISKAIEADPFVDVAHLLERYKSLRVSVDSDREDKSKTTSTAPSTSSNGSAPAASKPAETAAKPAAAPSFSMPAPPTSFAD
ncbi:hypothetical protein NUW54_g10143 [Trametes sanguinea]|uniref:Uncharacterized protein n=1 Tax=Trametes sanguinea TaxID=158606 RepID=A0ACC1P3Q0_9APHY|nr:hypothetical protein NUW54_g10143 [Trametes sanguinea]